ncbi:MAG: geranylgeranylglyceryl/heptaprenylglyceryl phosphate synthase [Gemmatimonadetes bacterium]|jgi:phosphoglycerol geranylgeranyltransferase|nr:geranylgeranylglyceryl/heptaprenylglyceryl phosphate synthase [Gemmatimonadota bacterium]MBT6149940.1 geranylgeranylglyceryl/heptaprenylglyceryl phosphate synthase [Gemmatimonadota bacterium]MBT7862918.1 geranylgeranylglyceryl/heptaprenylglyceryl phosphate synthase [Gemmatimonadota bacterium]
MTTFDHLLDVRRRRGAGYLTLLDPDRLSLEDLAERAEACAAAGADAILVGTSLMLSAARNAALFDRLHEIVDIPIISFPGDAGQVVANADAILFLSMVSGRNPELLIGQQVRAAPVLKEYGVEVIATAYMLIESGTLTSTEYMSATRPIPRAKADIAMAHALAAQYLGMGMVYLETGSGAQQSVDTRMVEAVSSYVDIPVIVGGGIRDADTAREKVEAGAAFIVTGTAVEDDPGRLRDISDAVHIGGVG